LSTKRKVWVVSFWPSLGTGTCSPPCKHIVVMAPTKQRAIVIARSFDFAPMNTTVTVQRLYD
jgi:peroxiredoxin